jgi:outer membrane immunogenic protein
MEPIVKKLVLAALLGTLALPAFAADMPGRRIVKSPVYVPPPVFSWTGVYAGVNAGYSIGDQKTRTIGTTGFSSLVPGGIAPVSLGTGGNGFAGGVQAGVNFQFGSIVTGLEADVQYVDQAKTARFTGNPVLGTALTTSASSELKWLGTLRGRVGFAADRLLVYGTGGFAFGEVETAGSVVGVAAPGLAWAGTNSATRTGWAAGGGVEYAFTDNISLKAEYLYYDLGSSTFTAAGNAAVRATAALDGVDYVGRSDTKGSLVRAGLNYRF